MPELLCRVTTSLQLGAWRRLLTSRLDEAFAGYILRGIEHGFRIGYNDCKQLRAAKHNMSAGAPTSSVEVLRRGVANGKNRARKCIRSSQDAGHSLQPFWSHSKGPGKWRFIADLSVPAGHSVYDGIEMEHLSLHYILIDDVVVCIVHLGKAKIDVKQVYHIVPVNPSDRQLLGMLWEGRVFVETRLPFGPH